MPGAGSELCGEAQEIATAVYVEYRWIRIGLRAKVRQQRRPVVGQVLHATIETDAVGNLIVERQRKIVFAANTRDG